MKEVVEEFEAGESNRAAARPGLHSRQVKSVVVRYLSNRSTSRASYSTA
jgi:hypothetical protein